MVPRAGARSPVIRRKRVVLPAPFRPTIPQRSPGSTVKVTFCSRIVAPNSTPISAKERMDTAGIWGWGSGIRQPERGSRFSGARGPISSASGPPERLPHKRRCDARLRVLALEAAGGRGGRVRGRAARLSRGPRGRAAARVSPLGVGRLERCAVGRRGRRGIRGLVPPRRDGGARTAESGGGHGKPAGAARLGCRAGGRRDGGAL